MPDPLASGAGAAPGVLTLAGDIDVARSDAILTEGDALLMDMPKGERLIVDVAGVEFIDSSGLSALLRLRRTAQERAVDVVLRGVPDAMATVMRLGGLQDVFTTE